jgi:hypothetical protein
MKLKKTFCHLGVGGVLSISIVWVDLKWPAICLTLTVWLTEENTLLSGGWGGP